jgi:hypothetical protein
MTWYLWSLYQKSPGKIYTAFAKLYLRKHKLRIDMTYRSKLPVYYVNWDHFELQQYWIYLSLYRKACNKCIIRRFKLHYGNKTD